MSTTYHTYEILFRNGTSVVLEKVNITVSSENRVITQIDLKHDPRAGDAVKFLDISEVICVVKRKKRGLFK